MPCNQEYTPTESVGFMIHGSGDRLPQ